MRGLLMIEPLYHATIAGKKTMTRRSGGLEIVNDCLEENYQPTEWVKEKFKSGREVELLEFMRPDDRSVVLQCSPRYKVGEVLYLKEPTAIITTHANPEPHIGYRYDLTEGLRSRSVIKWSNKLFMPASAARAFVKITGVKCERLLDITDEDCIAEGIEIGSVSFDGTVTTYINYLMHEGYGYDYIDNTPKQSFISLYKLANKLAKPGSVPPHGSLPTPSDVPNIWVWAYTYEYLPNYQLK